MPIFPPQNDPEESHDREDRKTEESTKDTRILETSHYGIEAVLPCLFLYICTLCTGLPLRHSKNDDKTLQVDDKPRIAFEQYGVKPSRASGKRSPLRTHSQSVVPVSQESPRARSAAGTDHGTHASIGESNRSSRVQRSCPPPSLRPHLDSGRDHLPLAAFVLTLL